MIHQSSSVSLPPAAFFTFPHPPPPPRACIWELLLFQVWDAHKRKRADVQQGSPHSIASWFRGCKLQFVYREQNIGDRKRSDVRKVVIGLSRRGVSRAKKFQICMDFQSLYILNARIERLLMMLAYGVEYWAEPILYYQTSVLHVYDGWLSAGRKGGKGRDEEETRLFCCASLRGGGGMRVWERLVDE